MDCAPPHTFSTIPPTSNLLPSTLAHLRKHLPPSWTRHPLHIFLLGDSSPSRAVLLLNYPPPIPLFVSHIDSWSTHTVSLAAWRLRTPLLHTTSEPAYSICSTIHIIPNHYRPYHALDILRSDDEGRNVPFIDIGNKNKWKGYQSSAYSRVRAHWC